MSKMQCRSTGRFKVLLELWCENGDKLSKMQCRAAAWCKILSGMRYKNRIGKWSGWKYNVPNAVLA